MILFATIDTSIFGRAYAAGELVDDFGWIRAQYLQMLNLGLVTTATGTRIVNGPSVIEGKYGPPSRPQLVDAPHGFIVNWDGGNEDGSSVKPPDWDRVEVHYSLEMGFLPTPLTLRGTFESPRGGSLVFVAGLEYVLGIADTYEVLLVHLNTSDIASRPSPRARITVAPPALMSIPDLSLTVIKFNSLQHLLY